MVYKRKQERWLAFAARGGREAADKAKNKKSLVTKRRIYYKVSLTIVHFDSDEWI